MSEAASLIIMVFLVSMAGFGLSRLSSSGNPRRESAAIDSRQSAGGGGAAEEQSLDELREQINRMLPQTQCAQCGYPGCRPYAEAIVKEQAPINLCPPGGDALITELADYLGPETIPLDTKQGANKPEQLALIIEPDCIGCTLCIAACPVDAIVGASQHMHTVLTDQCTGCELCLPPCPVDCIELKVIEQPLHRWQWPKPV